MDEDTIRVICGECIDKAQERFINQTCNNKHEEVKGLKETMDKFEKKMETFYERQNYILIVLLVAALGLIANLIKGL